MVCKLNIGDGSPLGELSSGSTQVHFQTPTGTLETVEGFEPAFKADVVWGADWLTFEPSGEHARVNLKALAKTGEGQAINIECSAIIAMNDGVRKVLTMQPDMATVPFGAGMGAYEFSSADPKLKTLQSMRFASSTRLVVSEGPAITAEARIAKVWGPEVQE
ncbi:hypothetical protein MMC10_004431 [Thelotrema lepadinum]|nr:hypothetical protein [Thelotrema lepadinum]